MIPESIQNIIDAFALAGVVFIFRKYDDPLRIVTDFNREFHNEEKRNLCYRFVPTEIKLAYYSINIPTKSHCAGNTDMTLFFSETGLLINQVGLITEP